MKKIIFLILIFPIIMYGQWNLEGNVILGENEGDFLGKGLAMNDEGSIVAVGAIKTIIMVRKLVK